MVLIRQWPRQAFQRVGGSRHQNRRLKEATHPNTSSNFQLKTYYLRIENQPSKMTLH